MNAYFALMNSKRWNILQASGSKSPLARQASSYILIKLACQSQTNQRGLWANSWIQWLQLKNVNQLAWWLDRNTALTLNVTVIESLHYWVWPNGVCDNTRDSFRFSLRYVYQRCGLRRMILNLIGRFHPSFSVLSDCLHVFWHKTREYMISWELERSANTQKLPG